MKYSEITQFLFDRYPIKNKESFVFQLIGAIIFHTYKCEHEAVEKLSSTNVDKHELRRIKDAIINYYRDERYQIILQLVWAIKNTTILVNDVVEIPYVEPVFNEEDHGFNGVFLPFENRIQKEKNLLQGMKLRTGTEKYKVLIYLAAIFFKNRDQNTVARHDATKLLFEHMKWFLDLPLPEPKPLFLYSTNSSKEENDDVADAVRLLYRRYVSGQDDIFDYLIATFSHSDADPSMMNAILNCIEAESLSEIYKQVPPKYSENYERFRPRPEMGYTDDLWQQDLNAEFFYKISDTHCVVFREPLPNQLLRLGSIDMSTKIFINANHDTLNNIYSALMDSTKKIVILRNLDDLDHEDGEKLLMLLKNKTLSGKPLPNDTKFAIEHCKSIPSHLKKILLAAKAIF